MAEQRVLDKQLIEALLRERDELYRRAVKAERRGEELSDTNAMKQQYETRIKELEAGRDKQISDMKAKHQKEISMKEDEIRSLAVRIEYLTRKLWGKMSEKRQTPDDPRQLRLDLEGMDLTEEEKRQIEEASKKVAESRKVKVKEHEKQVPVRKKLPENLRHVEEHIYPDGYLGHEDEWILFKDVETSEHLEITAPDTYVRVIIRHKAMHKSDNKIFTATAPRNILQRARPDLMH